MDENFDPGETLASTDLYCSIDVPMQIFCWTHTYEIHVSPREKLLVFMSQNLSLILKVLPLDIMFQIKNNNSMVMESLPTIPFKTFTI